MNIPASPRQSGRYIPLVAVKRVLHVSVIRLWFLEGRHWTPATKAPVSSECRQSKEKLKLVIAFTPEPVILSSPPYVDTYG